MPPRAIAASIVGLLSGCGEAERPARFVEVSAEVGLAHEHGQWSRIPGTEMLGGVAVEDFDKDGWLDVFVVGGDNGDRLFRNLGGGFEDVTLVSGLEPGALTAGALWSDYDGDGHLDLFLGGVEGTRPRMWRNENGHFTHVTEEIGLEFDRVHVPNTWSAAMGDHDLDGDLDLFVAHWSLQVHENGSTRHLWQNDGIGRFTDVSEATGIAALFEGEPDTTFTPNFADINEDGAPDLLIAADFGKSRVLLNRSDGTYVDATTGAITDEYGMGAAVADYDGDGHLDWFVTSIWHPDPWIRRETAATGNRLYRGLGDGRFEDRTESAGVAAGYWGWAACFADFDNDGHLDLFHVNGMESLTADAIFSEDPARLFLSNGDGTFRESSEIWEIDDAGVGVGVSCSDYDSDGDIDVFISNNNGKLKLYRNDLERDTHYLAVRLQGPTPNTQGVGASIHLFTPMGQQMREIRSGSNFLSQDPMMAHFGLGSSTRVNRVEVRWPDGKRSSLERPKVDALLTVRHPAAAEF